MVLAFVSTGDAEPVDAAVGEMNFVADSKGVASMNRDCLDRAWLAAISANTRELRRPAHSFHDHY